MWNCLPCNKSLMFSTSFFPATKERLKKNVLSDTWQPERGNVLNSESNFQAGITHGKNMA